MFKKLTAPNWSPWTTGVLMSFIFFLSLYLLDSPLGTNTAYSILIDKSKEIIDGAKPVIDWQIIFLIGTFVGALVASLASKSFKLELFPADHISKGASFYLTLGPVYSFLGGFLVMTGLILAGDSFLKLWSDSLGLYIIIGLFIVIVFIVAVILGTLKTIKIEEKK